MSLTYDDMPIGLPNIGNSCWLNSLLQTLSRSDEFVNAILQDRDNGLMHGMLANLFDAMDAKDREKILEAYRAFHGYVLQMHPIFRENSQNDSHEVLTYLINALHKEVARPVPDEIIATLDPMSKSILRDFSNTVSKVLETTLVCTSRVTSDNLVVYETYNTLFVEPLDIGNGMYSVQEALHKIKFASVPKVLFMSLMMSDCAQCKFVFDIALADKKYRLSTIIFFIPQVNHYITAVRRRRMSEEEPQGWYMMNDHMCNYITSEQLFSNIRAYPTLISYE